MTVAFAGKPGLLIDSNRELEASACKEMLHQRRGERRVLPETHALLEIASIVRQGHGEAQQVELSVALGGHGIESRLFAIDFRLDGGLRLFGGGAVTQFQQASETTSDRAPVLAIVPADAANGAD